MNIALNWLLASVCVLLFLGALYLVIKMAVRAAIREELAAVKEEFYRNLADIETESRQGGQE